MLKLSQPTSGILSLVLNGNNLWAGSCGSEIYVWDTSSYEHKILRGHEKRVDCLCNLDKIIMSASADSTICVWDAKVNTLIFC